MNRNDDILDDLEGSAPKKDFSTVVKVLLFTSIIIGIATTVAAWLSIFSIIASSVAVGIYGIILLLVAYQVNVTSILKLGLFLTGITITLFLFISFGNIGPKEAQKFVPHLMTFITFGIFVYVIKILKKD